MVFTVGMVTNEGTKWYLEHIIDNIKDVLANDNEEDRDCDCYDTEEDEKAAATETRTTVTVTLVPMNM
ncbi:hypothetical protein TSUD_170710 [Trifolium subterraneum]|uniref:Uncharacterized protein n=1 Tax=Trifolium subterraneum TaxID=3900 RepID=A0A2Z6MUL4_TRISU|nr:hypothetical protein TSUD_170710 [Trifolium subterraneum]